jgi:phenylpyruvate tautomerase PptA (4-oxalocrotonate tautomerase family)
VGFLGVRPRTESIVTIPQERIHMSQIKIYGLRSQLQPIREQLSDTIHSCIVEALAFPADKRAHRFFHLDREDFFSPSGRTDRYTIIEISMIDGRTLETKKKLINLLFQKIEADIGITPNDIEINISETPAHNWAFRGKPGDEHILNYKINV